MKDLISKTTDSIYSILRQIDRNTKGLVFITDENERFAGTVTDGDIRRAVLGKISLEEPVSTLLKSKPPSVIAHSHESFEAVKKRLSKKIQFIPVLDDDNHIIDYFEWKADIHFPIASTFITDKEISNVYECLTSNWISSQGRFVTEFESGFSSYIGCRFGTAVMNGTVALHLALKALNIGSGDEVVVPDLTFAATINAVLYTGATPVIVDIDKDTWGLNPDELKNSITNSTKAIIPVHLYGQPCRIEEICKIAEKHGIHVIEDCAESHGALVNTKKTGSFGIINCFSFYGNKIITTGEGGMCLTDDPDLNQRMKKLRDHGMSREKKYWHDEVGYNYRLTNLQAAIGAGQLERIEQILNKRDKILGWYMDCLSDANEIEFQKELQGNKNVIWLVSCLLDKKLNKENLIQFAAKKKIDIRPFFYPLSAMPPYKRFASKPTPVSSEISSRGFSLPTLIELEKNDYHDISENIKRCIQELKGQS